MRQGPIRRAMSAHRLCRIDELPRAEGRGFTIRDGARELHLFVMLRDGRPHAYLNRCPHTGVNLDWTPDRFLDWTGRMIQCATHGALFRIEDGYCVAGPCAGRSLTALPVREAGDVIEVLLPEETSPSPPPPAGQKSR
jgi:nitrite reductase/ring-hydroxylating ferredoxin subunit